MARGVSTFNCHFLHTCAVNSMALLICSSYETRTVFVIPEIWKLEEPLVACTQTKEEEIQIKEVVEEEVELTEEEVEASLKPWNTEVEKLKEALEKAKTELEAAKEKGMWCAGCQRNCEQQNNVEHGAGSSTGGFNHWTRLI